MTWKEALATGAPFIAKGDSKYGVSCIFQAGEGNNEVLQFDEDNIGYNPNAEPIIRPLSSYMPMLVLDWFETELEVPKKCICDFYSVILVSGCKCGGI